MPHQENNVILIYRSSMKTNIPLSERMCLKAINALTRTPRQNTVRGFLIQTEFNMQKT